MRIGREKDTKKKTQGYAVIEFNHGGILDNELKPEEFNQLQVSVLNALPADRKQPILRGCPAAVVNLATGEKIASFNMMNVAPTEYQKQALGRALYEATQRFMQDPENAKKFAEWKKQHEKDGSGSNT